MRILVLGIGSPFADDQAGWLVADQLAKHAELANWINQGQLVIEATDRPGLNLLTWLQADYQQVLLIDMVKTNQATAGTIYQLAAHEIIGFSGMLSSHNLGVSPSLALASALNLPTEHVSFWGIEGIAHRPEEEISPAVTMAINQLSQQLNTLLRQQLMN